MKVGIVGAEGVVADLRPALDDDETRRLARSASLLKALTDALSY